MTVQLLKSQTSNCIFAGQAFRLRIGLGLPGATISSVVQLPYLEQTPLGKTMSVHLHDCMAFAGVLPAIAKNIAMGATMSDAARMN